MHSYDPRHWSGWNWSDRGPSDPNGDHLVRFALLVAASLCFASFLPREMVAAAFAHFLWIGALAASVVAALLEESPRAPHLTYWDEAAGAVALALGTELLFPANAMAG